MEKKLVTADELLAMGDAADGFELISGVLVGLEGKGPATTGLHSSVLSAAMVRMVGNYAVGRRLGIMTDARGGFRLSRDPDTVMLPDSAFVAKERLPPNRANMAFPDLAPDLVVEIASPAKLAEPSMRKTLA